MNKTHDNYGSPIKAIALAYKNWARDLITIDITRPRIYAHRYAKISPVNSLHDNCLTSNQVIGLGY